MLLEATAQPVLRVARLQAGGDLLEQLLVEVGEARLTRLLLMLPGSSPLGCLSPVALTVAALEPGRASPFGRAAAAAAAKRELEPTSDHLALVRAAAAAAAGGGHEAVADTRALRETVRAAERLKSATLEAADDPDDLVAGINALVDQVNSEDHSIVAGIRRSVDRPQFDRAPLSYLERNVYDFGRYLATRLSRWASG